MANLFVVMVMHPLEDTEFGEADSWPVPVGPSFRDIDEARGLLTEILREWEETQEEIRTTIDEECGDSEVLPRLDENYVVLTVDGEDAFKVETTLAQFGPSVAPDQHNTIHLEGDDTLIVTDEQDRILVAWRIFEFGGPR